MSEQRTRRAVLGGIVGAGVLGAYVSPIGDVLEQFAPFSGGVWGAANPDRPERVESPYGEATVRYDDDGVPHIEADDEQALYYAAGHVQAIDRGFQMDLQRRLYSGRLAEVVGEAAVESDRFYRTLRFREAAEATADHLEDSVVGPILEAFSEGVTDGYDDARLSIGFQLLDYEPEPWRPADSMLVEKIIAWQLTGSFRTLRRQLLREEFDAELADQLYRPRMDHDSPIIRQRYRDEQYRLDEADRLYSDDTSDSGGTDTAATGGTVDAETVSYLTRFEPQETLGSNSWVVSSDLAGGNAPILCNDPHLSLQAPPVWYEMHLDGPDHRVRGVAFPGVPEVVIGETEFAAWGFTNAGTDVIDFYSYETDGESYRYGDERREFDEREETIEVADGEDVEITVRRTVHGPVVEEAEQEVAVAWTGHAATETTIALYELTRSRSFEETLSAIRKFDVPSQNFLYADRDDNTLYYTVGRHPIRQPSGETVNWDDPAALDGDGVFDGSAREGEWEGFEPFEHPSWDGFVPFAEKPHVVDPEYLATANQQIIPDDELPYYFAESYSAPYRGERIYSLLDERVESGEPLDLTFLQTVGRDVRDGRAAAIVDALTAAVRDEDEALQEAAETLSGWDYRMEPDSEAALLFQQFANAYREELLGDAFEEAGLGEEYYPGDPRLLELPSDSGWFGPGGRAPVLRRALRTAVETIDRRGYETYGDIAHTGLIDHLTELDFLGYESLPRGGSGWTVRNFGTRGPWGGSWEMQVDLDGAYLAVLPGGNSGRYFSEHYDSQLRQWANGEYRRLSREIEGEVTTEYLGGER
ncbi:penicillin acylase family protein [Halovenus sp. WSH3]|uniref:Penicillin acylase family protein n=1 Tax=Halovenus carboxidivorans TaxID=2692199 RepID=A0A6B0T1W2_9EURY|nr:penicillin acylase family protein [Halovenus carboxidivorans]MXR51147.1 penicillin acylase family protein [Halovenus carboxidivorans]